VPEFRRSWHEWRAEIDPGPINSAPAKTDENPSVSFVSPVARPRGGNEPTAGSCGLKACTLDGYRIDLGQGTFTILCAAHRRDLFRRAIQLDENGDALLLEEARLCRFCGRDVPPTEEPCTTCVARRSPFVRLALSLGALPICDCGNLINEPGGACGLCKHGKVI